MLNKISFRDLQAHRVEKNGSMKKEEYILIWNTVKWSSVFFGLLSMAFGSLWIPLWLAIPVGMLIALALFSIFMAILTGIALI